MQKPECLKSLYKALKMVLDAAVEHSSVWSADGFVQSNF
jgi:hypothetical protein